MNLTPVWIDGSFEGRIDPFDRGLLLGDGVFDTLTAFRGMPFAGGRHLERLKSHAEAIGIPLDVAKVREGWEAVLARSGAENTVLRTTVTRGVTERGLWPSGRPDPTIMVSTTPWNRSLMGRPVRLVTAAARRNPASPAASVKSLGYLDNILSAREAAAKGADDALLLNIVGQVACTTIANVFAVHGSEVSTPPLSAGIIAGIMRAIVLKASAAAGLTPHERSIEPAELFTADAVFLTNSVRFLSPVISLDGRALGDRGRNAVEMLRDSVAAQALDQCGVDPRLA